MIKTALACMLSAGIIVEMVTPASHANSTAVDLTDFNRIALSAPIKADVIVGDAFSVEFSGSGDDLAKLNSYVMDGMLVVKLKKRHRKLNGDVSAVITLPEMEQGVISGSGHMTITGLSGAFEAAISGSGRLTATAAEFSDMGAAVSGSGEISIVADAVTNAELAVSGSGKIIVTADECDDVSAAISGSGSVDLEGLLCETATTAISGSGKAKVFASDEITVEIGGSGKAVIFGNPETRHVSDQNSEQVTFK